MTLVLHMTTNPRAAEPFLLPQTTVSPRQRQEVVPTVHQKNAADEQVGMVRRLRKIFHWLRRLSDGDRQGTPLSRSTSIEEVRRQSNRLCYGVWRKAVRSPIPGCHFDHQ